MIGAGRGVTPLLSRMLEYDYIDVLMVIDGNPAAPGMLIASTMGVPHRTTGRPPAGAARAGLRVLRRRRPGRARPLIDELLHTANHRTTFLNPLATRFIMSLTKDARKLLGSFPAHGSRPATGSALDSGT